jgi:hypothetical protein
LNETKVRIPMIKILYNFINLSPKLRVTYISY